MKMIGVLSGGQDRLRIKSLDNLVKFTRYNTNKSALFIDCLELAEDFKLDRDTVIYPKDTVLSSEGLEKLLLLSKSNRRIRFEFQIKLSENILERLRSEIKGHFNALIAKRKAVEPYKRVFKKLERNLPPVLEGLLDDDKITVTLYNLLLLGDLSKNRRAVFFFDHAFETALFSLAIAFSDGYSNIIQQNKDRLVEIAKTGLFHNYNALAEIERILELPENGRLTAYWESIRKGLPSLDKLEMDAKVVDSIRHLCEYSMDKFEFLHSKRWPAVMANIVLVAIVFLQKERGLFGTPQPFKLVADQLSGRAMEGAYSGLAVQCLTNELNLKYLFDFYVMMKDLSRECPYKSAVPYPLTGFKSPTLFVCEKTIRRCPYLEGSRTTVNLVRDLGDLPRGKYNRCNLLTPQLKTFYAKHYEKIKNSDNGM